MNIHEFQAKKILSRYDLPIPNGIIYNKNDDLDSLVKDLKGSSWVVKSQIHAGGRGSGYFLNHENDKGGVRFVDNLNDLKKEALFMMGNTLVTKQTGKSGKKVNIVYIEEATLIKKEYYISLIIDRKVSKMMLMASISGGVDIEEVAKEKPEMIISYHFENFLLDNDHKFLKFCDQLLFDKNQKNQFISIIKKLLTSFLDLDASSIEINPLVIDDNDNLVLLDSKMTFDDNALFKHSEILKLRDESEEDPLELAASKNQMNYIKLDGSIGCMVNGAGLAMATMDIIKLYGSEPANFLDLGGTANKDRAKEGFKIIQSDPKVKSIFINIFGGIIRCDMIAEGIINAAKELSLNIPVIVRFQGTNATEGIKLINDTSLNIIAESSLNEAAQKAVELSKK